MKIEIYRMDRWHITPSIVYYNDIDWHGDRSIDFVWLKWGISIICELCKQKKEDI